MCTSCGQGVQTQLDELIAQIFWNGIKNKMMKQTIITKLTNSRRVLNTNNATVGEKATGATKKGAAAPKKDKKKDKELGDTGVNILLGYLSISRHRYSDFYFLPLNIF